MLSILINPLSPVPTYTYQCETPWVCYYAEYRYNEVDPSIEIIGDSEAKHFITIPGQPGKEKITIKHYLWSGIPLYKEASRQLLVAPIPEKRQSAIMVNGKLIPYYEKMRVKITAYSAEELAEDSVAGDPTVTATGVKLQRGIVAVDPRLIPLGTCMYIPGYGFAKALDTGGNIKQKRIDIAVNSREEALRWGVRYRTIYLVDCKYSRINLR